MQNNPLKTYITPDNQVNRFITETVSTVNTLLNVPILNGALIKIFITTNAEDFEHTLDRPVQGFLVVDTDSNVNIWQPDASPKPSTLIRLQADNAATVTLWVF